MKRRTSPLVFFVFAYAFMGAGISMSFAEPAKTVDCKGVGDTLAKAIQAEPEKVLVIVEDAVITNESCVCQIIQVAINSSNADPELVKQIILTASNVAPQMSANIRDCISSDASSVAGEGDKQVEDVYGQGDEDGGKSVSTVYDEDGGKSPQMVLPAENVNPEDELAMPNDDFSFEPNGPFRGGSREPSSSGGYRYRDDPEPPTDWDPISNANATPNTL